MTSLFGKIGIGAEKVYNVTSYPIAWTHSLYSWTTDTLVLPFANQVALPGLSYLADRTVVPLVNHLRGSASDPLDPEVELPKRPKRCGKCFDLKDLYNLCKWVKKHTYTVAHMQPTKIPDPEGLDRFDRIRNTVCGNAEKAMIQGFNIIYVVAEIGEKPVAVRLYLTEMGFELRPAVMKHVVKPICKDIKGAIAGPKIDSERASWTERFASELMSGAGDFFEKEGVALTNQYLTEKEVQIALSLANIEGQARDKAIILLSKVSNYMLREGLYFIVTPWLLSYITSPIVSSIGDFTGYVGTVNTVAYLLSYLKYVAWAKTAFIGAKKLYESCPPELTDEVRNQLYRSFSGKANPSKKLQKYPDIVTTRYDLTSLTQKFNVRIIELMPPLEVFIKASDSETLKKLQQYTQNFLRALKTKSDRTLRKYDLIDSPKVEEVFDEEIPVALDHSEAVRVPATSSPSITGTSPKASGESDRAPSLLGTLGKTAELAEDAIALLGSKKTLTPKRSKKKDKSVSRALDREPKEEKKPAPSSSLLGLFDKAVEITRDVDEPDDRDGESHLSEEAPGTPVTSSPGSPDLSILASPRKPRGPKKTTDLSSLIPHARRVVGLLDEALSPSPATPPPKADPKPVDDIPEKLDESESSSSSPRSPGFPRTPLSAGRATLPPPPKATSEEPKPADAAREETKETPTAPPHWLRRAAVVAIIAGGALLIGIKILNRFSLMPASLSKFSLPTNLEDNTAMKFLSSFAKLLFHLFKSSREESAK